MEKNFPGGRSLIREALKRKEVPLAAVEICLSSISLSTLRQYNSGLKRWWDFCSRQKLDVFISSPKDVLVFLSLEFDKGASFGTLNSIRAALGHVLNFDLGTNNLIKRFFKGVINVRPNLPKYSHIWDPEIVLKFLSNWDNNSVTIELLGKKLAVLLALATGHRVQTLSNIMVEDIVCLDEKIEIKIPNKIKTTAKNRYQPTLFIPFFKERPTICVASAIIVYLGKTKHLRSNYGQKLFLTHKKPFHDASSQTISRWIKDILRSSGIDTNIFSAHSTRHASTSIAAKRGVSIDTIRTTANWSEKSQTFARFYQRPIKVLENFAGAVLNPNSI
ncbi:uncharacterized protein LOC116160187 [Photinus pyralis]|uniref:uncharacterized protein LOC116160187 n=1 Tax=Photinus pyralis TaxID=7054 RepID=UPI001266EF25|nr:uncharacterized protein LOC116160187 [Photinus pyralis]